MMASTKSLRHHVLLQNLVHKQASWVFIKKRSVKTAIICMFQKCFVISPTPAFLHNQQDGSFCHRPARRGNHAVPNEGKLVGLPKWRCNKTACLTDG